MRILFLIAAFSVSAVAKPAPPAPPTFADTCRRLILFAPLTHAENGEVKADLKDADGQTVAQAHAMLSSDGMSLLKPAFVHYRGHAGDTELIIKILADHPQVQDVELSLGDEDLAIFKSTRGSKKARIRATNIYREFAAHGFTRIFFESVADDEVQVTFAKRGMVWRVLRY